MKNTLMLFSLLMASVWGTAQTEVVKKYQAADKLLQEDKIAEAYRAFKELEPKCDKKDTLYSYILWYYTNAVSLLEKAFRDNQRFDSSLHYELEALKVIEMGKPFFDEKYASREYFMTKNIVVSYFGLGQLENAKKYKDMLYKAYAEKKLPKGMDEYFNFSYFRWEDKNVWGYEWFEELPENTLEKSFSKIVYYVYSTNVDGTDKDQLYRLHVLMFHKIDNSTKFDYVLTKRPETAQNEVSGTLYAYTYNKDIDYKKLQADIREVLKGNYEPNTKTIINKEK